MTKERPVDVLFPEQASLKRLGLCPFCAELIFEEHFRDELSLREFEISGLCQACQDKMFGMMMRMNKDDIDK